MHRHVLAALTVLSVPALAAEEKVLSPYASYASLHSDNILLAPDDASAQALLGSSKLSDTFSRGTVGLAYDKEISRQHLTADLAVNRTSFNRLSQLDYQGKDFSANWNWFVGNHVEGNLGAIYVKTLTPFTDFHRAELNLQTQRREFFDTSWLFHPSWRLLGKISDESLDYSLASQQIENRNENVKGLGLDFIAASKSSIGLQLHQIRDNYPNFQQFAALASTARSKQYELKLKIDYRLSEKTQLVFAGGWAERKYALAPANDFSGFNARAIGFWSPGGKLNFKAAVWREIATAYDLASLYSLNQGLSIEPNWRISEKLRLLGSLKYETRDYVANVTAAGQRRDIVQGTKIALSYSPFQHFLLDASLTHDVLRSTIPYQTYRANSMMVSGEYKF